MKIAEPASWPTSAAEAIELQLSLRQSVKLENKLAEPVRTVAGLDVTYDSSSSRIVAAAVVMKVDDFTVLEEQIVTDVVEFPYIPGLFAFRELPALVKVMREMSTVPDVLICDGHGVAHVRRFGLACHVGLLANIPTIGVAKNNFVGSFETPGWARGSRTPILHGHDIVGYAVRTRNGVKPVFVSAGHLIDISTALQIVLQVSRDFRIPEPVRQADHISRHALK